MSYTYTFPPIFLFLQIIMFDIIHILLILAMNILLIT